METNISRVSMASSSKEMGAEAEGSQEDVKVIPWEDFEQELTRLWSLTSALNEAKQKRLLLYQKLEPLIKVKTESLSLSNELDMMHEKLESRKLVMGKRSMHSKVVEEKAKKREEQLVTDIRNLLVSGTAFSSANKRLQDAARSLVEDKYPYLRYSQKLLRLRQQYMVSQVSLLYPVKSAMGHAHCRDLESFAGLSRSGISFGSKSLDQGSLTISGLHLSVLPSMKMGFFTDKKEVQRSATALGYVAHALLLISSYLHVPLRFPLRLGGSRSYICDHAPSTEPSCDSSTLDTLVSASSKPVEFPLFLEGRDTTRAAYAVFLLNKDLEQLLNFVDVESLGPRHVLGNLKELLRTIFSPAFVDR